MGRTNGHKILMCMLENERKVMTVKNIARILEMDESDVREASKGNIHIVYMVWHKRELIMKSSLLPEVDDDVYFCNY